MTTVRRSSDAVLTAPARSAGPAPTIVRSYSDRDGAATMPRPAAWLSPDGQVGFVALGIGESPPAGRVGVADDPAAGRERGVYPGLYQVVRQVDVDVEAVAPGPRRLRLLEPERRPLAVRVTQDLFAAYGVAEHGRTLAMSRASIATCTCC